MRPSGRPFLFNVVVWGESYTRKLLDFTIPTLLAPDNLPAIVKRRSCEFLFATTSGDAEIIQVSESYKRLQELLPTVFVFPNFEGAGDNKYARMTVGHKEACAYGHVRGAYGVFLMPEMLVSNGSLLYLDNAVRRGKRAVIMVVLRLIEENVEILRGLPMIRLENRELVSLLFSSAHPEIRSFIVNGDRFSAEPGYVIWDFVDRGGVWVAHGIHSQPMLVDLLTVVPNALGHALDAEDFVRASVNDVSEIDVVMDSDLAMMCSLTPLEDVPTAPSTVPPTPAGVRKFIRGTPYVTGTHLWYFTHPVVLHCDDMPDDIGACLEISKNFVAEVLGY